jgi:hypothetical protein
MNAKKLALRVSWSSELNEDSLIPVIANYRRQSLRAMQNAIDNVLVNGDTATGASTNVNLIDGTPTSSTVQVMTAPNRTRKSQALEKTESIAL